MDLTPFSGSPIPNAFALGCVVILTVITFATRQRTAGVISLVTTVLVGGTIAAKNIAYNSIVAEVHGENNMAAHRDYADALLWVGGAQIGVCLLLVVCCLMVKEGKGRFAWLAAFAGLACAHAAICTIDWSCAYSQQDASQPVSYGMVLPWAHWAMLGAMVAAGLAFVVSLVWHHRRQH